MTEAREPARFILSLDCEGKWGMADILEPYHHELFTSDRLAGAYERLVGMFERFGIDATFAFVMAFLLNEEERKAFGHMLDPREDRRDAWLEPYWAARKAGKVEGWHLPQALDIVRSRGKHEVACHGFCHRPLGDRSISHDGAVAELAAADAVARMKGVDLRTLVFPRNDVGHLEAVRQSGFIGYRERLRRPRGKLRKAVNLAEELNLWPRRQTASPPDNGLVSIPPGYFFNWRFGARRFVPKRATVARWRNLLRSTVRSGGVVHLWLHPHNLVTAPETGGVLERVLAEVAELSALGLLRVVTQDAFATELVERPRDAIDEAGVESFPASDPPSWTLGENRT